MKFNKKIPFLFILSLTSCQQELVYNPFELSENGLSRYLSLIEETTYSNSVSSPKETTTILFNNPEYDKNGRLNFAYNNFSGYEANYSYSYSDNDIETIANRKNGEVIRRKYTLQNNIITSCLETSNINDYVKNYHYYYDDSNMLVKIEVSDEEYDNRSQIFIEWDNANISSVEVALNSGYTTRYDFKYSDNNHCDPNIPFFFTSCYEIGGTYGVDELLSMQNYFGISRSEDLPKEVYFNNKISRVFEYAIGKDGSLSRINQLNTDNNKTIRTYSFKWR